MQDALPWGSAFFYGENPWIIKYSQKIFRQTESDVLKTYNDNIRTRTGEKSMIDDYKNGKIERILGIYTKLLSGNIVNKLKEAQEYGVNERTIQRDIEDIRSYMETEAERTGCIN